MPTNQPFTLWTIPKPYFQPLYQPDGARIAHIDGINVVALQVRSIVALTYTLLMTWPGNSVPRCYEMGRRAD